MAVKGTKITLPPEATKKSRESIFLSSHFQDIGYQHTAIFKMENQQGPIV